MLSALPLALRDLADRRIVAILIQSLLITLLIFIGLGVLVAWGLDGADPCGWVSYESCPLGGIEGGLGAFVLTAIGLWLLFPAIAIGVVSAYMDRVVAVVEDRNYPAQSAGARPMGVLGAAGMGLRSTLRIILYNLIALPFYLLLMITGVGTIALFVLVNGLALGHDLGEMVAARYGDRALRRVWLSLTRLDRFVIGAAVTALFLVPFLNLLAPIIGAAAMTHLYHRRPATVVPGSVQQ